MQSKYLKKLLDMEYDKIELKGFCMYTRVPGGFIYSAQAFNGNPAFCKYIPISEVEKDLERQNIDNKMNNWILLEDQKPEDAQFTLCFDGSFYSLMQYCYEENCFMDMFMDTHYDITHWHTLTPPS